MDDCERYLRQPGFERLWPLLKAKYESYNRAAGAVKLPDPTPEERDALGGLLQANLLRPARLSVSLLALDEALRGTRFGITLEDALRIMFGDEFMPKAAALEQDRQHWSRFTEWAVRQAKSDFSRKWFETLASARAVGYRSFLECFAIFKETGDCPAWRNAVAALDGLPAAPVRLPIYAARVMGDPHGLDRTELAGRLFLAGLRDRAGRDVEVEAGASAEAVRQLYAEAGLIVDDVSSVVLAAGWPGLAELPVALTLWALERTPIAPPSGNRVFATENPSVFGAIADHFQTRGLGLPFSLVCVSGQPSLAALKLLDAAAEAGAAIHYAGDFDVKGLEMACRWFERYSDSHCAPWRMGVEDYLAAVHPGAPTFMDVERSALERLSRPWNRELVAAMLRCGRKAFQEQLVDRYVEDVAAVANGSREEAVANGLPKC